MKTYETFIKEKLDIQPISRERLLNTSSISELGKIVKIGNSYWTASNLSTTICADGSHLRLHKDYFFGMKKSSEIGLLYTYDAAKRIVPNGWHLPTINDIRNLRMVCDDKVTDLLSVECGGSDKFGFNAKYCGIIDSTSNNTIIWDDTAFAFWVNERGRFPYQLCISNDSDFFKFREMDVNFTEYAMSVRLVKD